MPALSHHVEQVVQLVEDGVGKDDKVAAGPHLPLPEAMRGSRKRRRPPREEWIVQQVAAQEVEEPGGRGTAIGPWRQAPTPKHLTMRPAIPGEHLR